MSSDRMRAFLEQLGNPDVVELRQSTCHTLAEGLCATGNVLWCFNLAPQPRRGVAAAIQMAGQLSRGAVSLLRAGNQYASAALVRQLVEIEYLLCLFAIDKAEPERWASADTQTTRREYAPARMRERCADRFRPSEYSTHCEMGGHPRYVAGRLLPEHISTPPLTDAALLGVRWVDLGQHLIDAWHWVGSILHEYQLTEVGLARSAAVEAAEAIERWRAGDPCAARLSDAEVDELRASHDA